MGVYGLSLLIAMSGGALCLALLERNRFGVGVVVTVAFIWTLSALVKPLDWTQPCRFSGQSSAYPGKLSPGH